jgi:hypothetical protein
VYWLEDDDVGFWFLVGGGVAVTKAMEMKREG